MGYSFARQASSTKLFSLILVFTVFGLLPFFEGGETALGLFLFHTITLFGLAFACLLFSRIIVPKFIFAFLPFFLVLIVSFLLSPYKFASFLKLWDYFEAGIWTILVCTLIQTDREGFQRAAPWLFVVCVSSIVLGILIFNTPHLMTAHMLRIRASFLNPNDYASFALLLFCFGLYCFEREENNRRKAILLTFLSILLLSVALSFSRGVFVAVLSILAFTFLMRRPGKVMGILLIVLVCTSGLIVALRYKFYEDPYQYYRIKIWKNSLRSLVEDPYLGGGLGMLEYRSNKFNFPNDTEIGRYGRVARSADNQYIQILAETGSLGFFTFLFGWIALAFYLRSLSERFFYPKIAWLVLTVTGMFSLPLQNTSVLFAFLFLIAFTASMDHDEKHTVSVVLKTPGRILIPVASFLLFFFGVYLPFMADYEFHLAITSARAQDKERHLAKAVRYNPYQPYYRFVFIRLVIDARPDLDSRRWMAFDSLLDESIALNPIEFEFYQYKARVAKLLLEKNPTLTNFSTAVSSYQNAIDCNPYNVFLRLEFASFLFQSNRYDVAKSEVEQILKLEPAFLNARLLLIALLLETNHPQEARVEYDRFVKDHARYRIEAVYASSAYVRLLLAVNPQQKRRVEELYRKAQS